MPTYEYACTSCSNQWEEIQKISEAALEVCPKCHQATARRQISGGRFILKGGGWDADPYSSVKPGKKDDPKPSPKSEGGGGESGGSGGGGGAASRARPPPGPPPPPPPPPPPLPP